VTITSILLSASDVFGKVPHVVTAWIGNSAPVAAKHYLGVTDADFDRASRGGAESGARAAHNPAQSGDVLKCTDMTNEPKTPTPREFVHPMAP
jgi:hypothetical protein